VGGVIWLQKEEDTCYFLASYLPQTRPPILAKILDNSSTRTMIGVRFWIPISSLVLLLIITQTATALDYDIEEQFDEEVVDIDVSEKDVRRYDHYYWNDGRASCKDSLPSKMTSNSNCKKLKKTCSNLKNKCSSKLGTAIGSSTTAKKCKSALGSNANKKVREFCKIRCSQCANGAWGSWTSYGSCSVTCDAGTKTRTRSCSNPSPFGGGSSCSGSSSQSTSCNDGNCAVHGNWAAWGDWTACSTTCATLPHGFRQRYRNCTDPAPLYGGIDCDTSTMGNTSTETCNTDINCPVHGDWEEWTAYSSCNATCGDGKKVRTRVCGGQEHNGDPCAVDPAEGYLETVNASNIQTEWDFQDCNILTCPVDGNWGQWDSWGLCSLSCDTGTRSRTRLCDDPPQAGTGADCVGDDEEWGDCNTESCDTATTQAPVDGGWGSWSSYSSCSKTCETGTQSRSRECDNPVPVGMGADCSGDSEETTICNTNSCTDGEMTVTTEMTFSGVVSSSYFDTIKDDLKEAIATTLGVDSSYITLTLKSSITRSSSTVVVVTITSTDEDEIGDIEDAIESSSFVSSVNTEISNSGTLSGISLDSVTDPTTEGVPEPPEAPKKPDPPCFNIQDYRTCGKAAMNGKCAKPWWQWQCKATCKRCCGNIWPIKTCRKLLHKCKKSGKDGRDVRNKCRKACKKCK